MSIAKVVALSAIRNLVENSYEHLGILLDAAIAQNVALFGEDQGSVRRLATFKDRMVVGTANGSYFDVKFEHINGAIEISSLDEIDVPVVTTSNAAKSMKEFSLRAVDALMAEGSAGAVDQLLALSELQGQSQIVESRDYPEEATNAVSGDRPWRQVLAAQRVQIDRQVIDKLESIRAAALESKYHPLYESDEIPEAQFESYRKSAESDLGILSDRLTAIHRAVAHSYDPFRSVVESDGLDDSESDVIAHFCFFAEDLQEDLQGLNALVVDTIENEQCVMCLGQVYDSIAESLMDCEIAGVFVQRMAGALNDAV